MLPPPTNGGLEAEEKGVLCPGSKGLALRAYTVVAKMAVKDFAHVAMQICNAQDCVNVTVGVPGTK